MGNEISNINNQISNINHQIRRKSKNNSKPPLAPESNIKKMKKKLSKQSMNNNQQQEQQQQQNNQHVPKTYYQDARVRFLSIGDAHVHKTEEEVVTILSTVIEHQVNENDKKKSKRTEFCGNKPAKITIYQYLQRIIHYLTGLAVHAKQTDDEFVSSDLGVKYVILGLIYLDKLQKKNNFVVNSKNVHRCLITAILIAAKFSDDILPNNKYFASLGGVTLKEINKYEMTMCNLLKFEFYVSSEQFDAYYNKIMTTGDAINFIERKRSLSTAAIAA